MVELFFRTNGLIIVGSRVFAMCICWYAVHASIHLDRPKRDQTAARIFIAFNVTAATAISLAAAFGIIGERMYLRLIYPAASAVYLSLGIGAYMFIRAARFRNLILRPIDEVGQ